MAKPTKSMKRADQYNDKQHNYQDYWQGRDYEHLSEVLALNKLLKGRHFKLAVDVGGGYGRLSTVLAEYADKVVLAEPSQQQLDLADNFLGSYPQIDRRLMQADKLDFKDGTVDLLTLIRVLHHLPEPRAEFKEIARVLTQSGRAVIEVANYLHMRNRLKLMARGQTLPDDPVDIRSAANRQKDEIAFVNHNPATVAKQLENSGLQVEAVLSVSNLRSPRLKKVMPRVAMLKVEEVLQKPLANVYFGPSIFFLVHK